MVAPSSSSSTGEVREGADGSGGGRERLGVEGAGEEGHHLHTIRNVGEGWSGGTVQGTSAEDVVLFLVVWCVWCVWCVCVCVCMCVCVCVCVT